MAETATIVFPKEIYAAIGGYDKSITHATAIATTDTGREQRRFKYPKLGYGNFQFKTVGLTDPILINTMRSFLESVRGGYVPFIFYEPQIEFFKSEEIGVTDGGGTLTLEWNGLNSWATESGHTSALEVDGSDVDYGIGNGTYPAGDVITWLTSTPPAGQSVVLFNFWGRRRYICRLSSDTIRTAPAFGGVVAIDFDPLHTELPLFAQQFELSFKQVR